MTFTEREALYFPILVAAFLRHSLPPEWGPAIAHQESAFIVDARNNSAGDKARGGSWGLCQMSLLTAQSLGFKGAVSDLVKADINAELAATLCEEICRRFKTRNLADVASAYNSGRRLAQAPKSTREVYVPRVTSFALTYQARAAEVAAKLNAPPPRQIDLPGVSPAAIRGGE